MERSTAEMPEDLENALGDRLLVVREVRMDGTFEGETFPHSYARWRTGFLAGPWHAELLHTRASHSRMWDLPGRNETGLGHKAQSAKADISAGPQISNARLPTALVVRSIRSKLGLVSSTNRSNGLPSSSNSSSATTKPSSIEPKMPL